MKPGIDMDAITKTDGNTLGRIYKKRMDQGFSPKDLPVSTNG